MGLIPRPFAMQLVAMYFMNLINSLNITFLLNTQLIATCRFLNVSLQKLTLSAVSSLPDIESHNNVGML